MPLTLTNKLFSLYVRLRYPSVPPELRYFYRDTYNCEMAQLKYVSKDYIFKQPYKDITFSGEFAPELEFVLPFAYWHYKNGTLRSTHSAKYTKEIYFFSPEHHEDFDVRSNEGNYNFETPRILYSHDYDIKKWLPVPMKAQYQNDIYVYDKPILVIANRYNMEWDGPPISYYSIEALDYMISNLKNDYTIIYNRPRPENITMDNSDIYDLNEFDWLAETHPEVILMKDLWKENRAKANNFNHLQLMVYANASHFISVHGGTAALASYFGGVNIVISKKGPEHHFKCFDILYPKLSGAKVLHAKTDDEVKQYIQQHYIVKPR
ncbi:hypothetical protein [Mucilaginibacter agri]|uniref:Uncharacterized protein n=1 Tax=Mucilaginibacter agri TaxID=2695265 RepID=A0A965ZHH3_9SPHI|nr:hypothetical protein [Mucilaginibacter agri]NCD70805.1 hypothetical protein [Mucilaginibacter agri]